jgi:hypothetical protein
MALEIGMVFGAHAYMAGMQGVHALADAITGLGARTAPVLRALPAVLLSSVVLALCHLECWDDRRRESIASATVAHDAYSLLGPLTIRCFDGQSRSGKR